MVTGLCSALPLSPHCQADHSPKLPDAPLPITRANRAARWPEDHRRIRPHAFRRACAEIKAR